MSNKQATAYGIAHLILNLPTEIAGLHILYDDCDCGYGPHEVNSLYPDKDNKCNIYLRPTRELVPIDEIVAEYNRLKVENEEINKQVEKARAEGIEVQTHNEPPEGWDSCELKTRTGRVVSHFDPHNENNANGIIEYFRDAIKKWYAGYSSDENKLMNFLDVGYPGKRQQMPFILDKLDIQMVVDEMSVSTDEYSQDRYMYLKLHFKVQINWKPDLSNQYWEDIDVKYDHLDVYEFDDTLTLMLLPLGTKEDVSN